MTHKPASALALAGRLSSYWLLTRRVAEGRRWIRTALVAAGEAAPPQDRARALLTTGFLADSENDPIASRRAGLDALELFRAVKDQRRSAACLVILADADDALGRREQAHALASHAEALAPRCHDRQLVALALQRRALTTRPLKDALSTLHAAVEQLTSLGIRPDAEALISRFIPLAHEAGEYAIGYEVVNEAPELLKRHSPASRPLG